MLSIVLKIRKELIFLNNQNCSKKLRDAVLLFKQRIDYLILFEQDELEEYSDEEVEN